MWSLLTKAWNVRLTTEYILRKIMYKRLTRQENRLRKIDGEISNDGDASTPTNNIDLSS